MNYTNRRTSMHPLPTNTDLERIYAIHNIIAATRRMSEQDHYFVDERSYALQFPVTNLDDINKVKNAVYVKLRECFDFSEDASQIGMIIGGDVNGTRSKTVGEWDRQNPHLHAHIILPESLNPWTLSQKEAFFSKFRSKINTLKEVPLHLNGDPSKNKLNEIIHLAPFQFSGKSVDAFTAYTAKADKNYSEKFGEAIAVSVYPYDKTLDAVGGRVDYSDTYVANYAFLMHLFPERIFIRKDIGNLTRWQFHYRTMYLEVKTKDKRDKVKSRFVQLIRDYSV